MAHRDERSMTTIRAPRILTRAPQLDSAGWPIAPTPRYPASMIKCLLGRCGDLSPRRLRLGSSREKYQSARPCRPRSHCLIVLVGQTDAAAIYEHDRTCRSRIARCARATTAPANRRNFDPAPRKCAGVDRRCAKAEPAGYRHRRNPCRECVRRKADPRFDVPPGHLRRPAARHRTHPVAGVS
jgi:hypothetical protein